VIGDPVAEPDSTVGFRRPSGDHAGRAAPTSRRSWPGAWAATGPPHSTTPHSTTPPSRCWSGRAPVTPCGAGGCDRRS